MIISKNVVFIEDASWNINFGNVRSNLRLLSTDEEVAANPTPLNFPNPSTISSRVRSSSAPTRAAARDESLDEPILVRRSNHRYANNINNSFQYSLLVSHRVCYEEAAEQSERMNALVEEMQAIVVC